MIPYHATTLSLTRIIYLALSQQSFLEDAKNASKKVLDEGPEKIKAYKALMKELFPHPSFSAVASTYGDHSLIAKNVNLEATIGKTLDTLEEMANALVLLEEYVTLNIPKMEDGNNFGVTVQMSAQQHLTQAQEDIMKDCEDLLKYKEKRAEAVEKCKLPSKSTVVSTTISESESKGKTTKAGEAGDNESEEKKTAKESKTTETGPTESPDVMLRAEAVMAVDVMFYGRTKAALRYAIMSYMTILNFFDLNQEKIDQPKGSRGSGGAYSSMY